MEWYYIVMIVIGYFILAIAAGVLCAKMEGDDIFVPLGTFLADKPSIGTYLFYFKKDL